MHPLLERVCLPGLLAAGAVLLLSGASPARLEAQTDVIRGRVAGVDGQPLASVRVTATSVPGNVTRTAQTNGEGRFQIAFANGTGDYIMGYMTFGYAFRQFEIKRLADEEVLIADASLTPIQLDSLVVEAAVRQRVNRNAQGQDAGTEQAVTAADLPAEAQGNIAAMAASLPGVLLLPGLDGDADAFSVLGLGADQNSVTLNGMAMGANGLPRDAAVSSALTTSSYDVSRGGFSGGNFNFSSRPGSNYRVRGASLQGTSPQLQWTDRAAQALGNDYTNLSLSAITSGPLSPNKAFYSLSFQIGRDARENQTLLNTSELGLRTAGVSADSVARFLGILQQRGIPTLGGPGRSQRLSDNGSVFGSIDFTPPNSSSGQSLGINFNGSWGRQSPVAAGYTPQLGLESAGGDRTNWGAGLQARHSGYLGMVLSESSIGFNLSRNSGEPYLALPGGRVRVSSAFEDGSSGVETLAFGGSQGLSSSSRTTAASLQNSLSWFDAANKHRVRLSTELRFSGLEQDQSANLLGTYTFNSLADLEAGRAASLSRTLTATQRSTGLINGAISLGDSYRRTPNLQFQYGIRIDASHFTNAPSFNPLVKAAFGRRNDEVPTPVTFSPRIGFSWTVGQAQEIASFMGAARAPRAVVRGGIGMFANNLSSGQLGAALDHTGLPDGSQQIMCVGPAVPFPEWTAFVQNPDAIPDRCADGSGTVFSSSVPDVTMLARDFAPSRSLRSNLSWSGSVLDARFSLNLEGSYSLNLGQQRSFDLNFNPTTRFNLADDGRPVYVQPTSIVASTGAIAARDARTSQSFARVTELRSDLESRTAQLSLRLSPIARTPTRFGWSAAYTWTNVREQVSGFSSTAGDPLAIEWGRSSQGPHQLNYSLRYRLFDAVQINWSGSFRSGSAFTPMVMGDVNGDGYGNDRAFIFDPASTTESSLAAGMAQLLEQATGRTRECLEQQLGRIAGRSSCRGPWSSSASLSISLDRAKFRMPQRGELSFSLSNPLGAADLLLHGSDNLKGWGQNPTPDAGLLYVRGFDAQSRQYRYEVNQRFGATRPQFLTLRSPVTLTAMLRIDLGPTREQQQLQQQLDMGRNGPGSRMPASMFRAMGSGMIPNPLSTILRSQDSLRLSATQADSIAVLNRRYTYRADSLWRPVAQRLAELPENYDADVAHEQYLRARRAQIGMLTDVSGTIRSLLTAEQRRKLPGSVINMLDARYLALIRDGNRLYLGSSGSSGGALGMAMATEVRMIEGGIAIYRMSQ